MNPLRIMRVFMGINNMNAKLTSPHASRSANHFILGAVICAFLCISIPIAAQQTSTAKTSASGHPRRRFTPNL